MNLTKFNLKMFLILIVFAAAAAVIAGCNNKTTSPTPVTSTPTRTSTAVVNTATKTATLTFTETRTATATFSATATATMTATTSASGQLPVVLGTSARFAVLSSSIITDVPACSITGDVGISPGLRSNISGLLNGDGQVIGTGSNGAYAIYAADDAGTVPAMLIQAETDATNAYLDATSVSRGTPTLISGDQNGITLYPGLYESSSSIEISTGGILYLDGQGNANAVFIIRSATSITTSGTSSVVLEGSAQAKNVFWVAGSAITLGTNSVMKGTIIASSSISILTGASLQGRALLQGASAAQISLDTDTIVLP